MEWTETRTSRKNDGRTRGVVLVAEWVISEVVGRCLVVLIALWAASKEDSA